MQLSTSSQVRGDSGEGWAAKGVLNKFAGLGDAVGMSIVRRKKVNVVSFTVHKDTTTLILREAGFQVLSPCDTSQIV